FDELYVKLGEHLNNTGNMPTGAKTISKSADGKIIYVPAKDQYIALDDKGAGFRLEFEKQLAGERVQVRAYGRYGATSSNVGRGVALDYVNMPEPTQIFNYGVATKGTVTLGS